MWLFEILYNCSNPGARTEEHDWTGPEKDDRDITCNTRYLYNLVYNCPGHPRVYIGNRFCKIRTSDNFPKDSMVVSMIEPSVPEDQQRNSGPRP